MTLPNNDKAKWWRDPVYYEPTDENIIWKPNLEKIVAEATRRGRMDGLHDGILTADASMKGDTSKLDGLTKELETNNQLLIKEIVDSLSKL